MASPFPTALDSLSISHVPGEVVASATDNNHADAINKIERAVRLYATYVVASSTAPAAWKTMTNYVCDGTADQVEINAALTALGSEGGVVILSNGTFNLSGSVSVPNVDAVLRGMGKATNFVMSSGMATAAIIVNGPTAGGNWGTAQPLVEDLRIDGSATSGANTGAHGLEVSGAVLNGTYRRLWITNCKGHSVYMHSASGGERPAYNLLDHCNIQTGSRDGVRLGDDFPSGTYAEHNDIRNCVITYHTVTGTYGIYATGNNNRITDCQFDNLQIGVGISGGSQNHVTGCTFDRNIANCLVLSGQGNHTIAHNMFSDHITGAGALVNPGTNRSVSQTNGCSGNAFLANHHLLTSPAPWQYAYGEDSGCGSTANYGPSKYIGNTGGNIAANQFSGTAPITSANNWQSGTTW